MKNNWYKWLLLVWLFLLSLVILALIVKTQETIDEQQAQKEILIHQTEIIALNTVILRALAIPDQASIEESE